MENELGLNFIMVLLAAFSKMPFRCSEERVLLFRKS